MKNNRFYLLGLLAAVMAIVTTVFVSSIGDSPSSKAKLIKKEMRQEEVNTILGVPTAEVHKIVDLDEFGGTLWVIADWEYPDGYISVIFCGGCVHDHSSSFQLSVWERLRRWLNRWP